MKVRKKLLYSLLLLVAAVSCSTDKQSKTLVLYYSQTGATRAVAEEIARMTGADIESIDVIQPYDGTYQETIQRCNEEGSSPEFIKAVR